MLLYRKWDFDLDIEPQTMKRRLNTQKSLTIVYYSIEGGLRQNISISNVIRLDTLTKALHWAIPVVEAAPQSSELIGLKRSLKIQYRKWKVTQFGIVSLHCVKQLYSKEAKNEWKE